MASPPPPDPYAALGVTKDADLGQIRTAHRKLVLKHHPDRIRGDDVEEKIRAKNEFQKVQQAYELLSDSSRRARYDDQIRLIELQKERMMREPTRPSAYSTKHSPPPTFVRREMRSDGNFYEERAPPTSYFDSRDKFDEPLPQTSARKHEASYEKERKPSVPKSAEKKEKFSAKMSSPVEGISMRMAFQMKAKASQAKERTRESHARTQETRDRERDRERSEKHSGRRAYAAEVHSESESDTIVPKSSPRSRRASPRTKPESESGRTRAPPVRRHATSSHDEDSYDEAEKWERHHKSSMDYIAESKNRPSLNRGGSDAYSYWAGDHSTGRRSGSDTEKRPASSRRTKGDDSKSRPAMPVHNSAPSNLKAFVEERGPERSKTNPYPQRDARPTPSLGRSQTLPINKSSRKDTLPVRSSNLKNEVPPPQDSGYYSSSNPHTPEMHGESPPPSRENSKKKGNSTKYQIVDPEGDDDRASRIKILGSDEENRHRRYRSPEPERREKDRERDRNDRERDRGREDRDRPRMRERPVRTESDSRTRSSKGPAPSSYSRSEFRETPPVSRPKLYREISSDEKDASYSYPYEPSHVRTASYRAPTTPGYGYPRFREADDDYPGSTFKDHMRNPHSRRPSAAY